MAASPALRVRAIILREKGAELTVTDLYPGMTIEVTAAKVTLPDRPSWLSADAPWPPPPDGVMYMIRDSSVGVCDRCITNESKVQELVTQYGGKQIIDRGDTSWYCSVKFGTTAHSMCQRHWNGRRYDK